MYFCTGSLVHYGLFLPGMQQSSEEDKQEIILDAISQAQEIKLDGLRMT